MFTIQLVLKPTNEIIENGVLRQVVKSWAPMWRDLGISTDFGSVCMAKNEEWGGLWDRYVLHKDSVLWRIQHLLIILFNERIPDLEFICYGSFRLVYNSCAVVNDYRPANL